MSLRSRPAVRRRSDTLIALVFLLLITSGAGAQQATQQEVRFQTALPVEFSCVPSNTCSFAETGLRMVQGGKLRFNSTNVSAVTFQAASDAPAVDPRLSVAVKGNTCADTASAPAVPVTPTSDGSVTVRHGSYGAVCVELAVLSTSPVGVLIPSAAIRRLTAEEIRDQILLERIQQRMIDPLRNELAGVDAAAIRARLDGLEQMVSLDLQRAALRFSKSGDIVFEANLALALNDISKSTNPLSYRKFQDVLQVMEKSLAKDPVGLKYLGTLQQSLKSPPNRWRTILGAAANVAEGVLTVNGFGTVANGLRALFATTFSRPAVESREGAMEVGAIGDHPAGSPVRWRDLPALMVRLTQGSNSQVVQSVNQGLSKYAELDSLLSTLDRANADVNVLTDRLAEVSALAVANESAFLGTFSQLVRSVGRTCDATDCGPAAARMVNSAQGRDSILGLVTRYFTTQRAAVAGMTPEQRSHYNHQLGELEEGLKELTSGDEPRYELMVGTYRSFFEILNGYVAASKNPFGAVQSCTNAADSSRPACEWELHAASARARLAVIYPARFNQKYSLD